MAEYVALLRGINVGGHGVVTMEDLKKAFEACAFQGREDHRDQRQRGFFGGDGGSGLREEG